MLCALLLDHFIHRSHRNTAVDAYGAAVSALIDDELLCCSSGSAICSSVFGVSCCFFPSILFNHYRPPFAGIS